MGPSNWKARWARAPRSPYGSRFSRKLNDDHDTHPVLLIYPTAGSPSFFPAPFTLPAHSCNRTPWHIERFVALANQVLLAFK